MHSHFQLTESLQFHWLGGTNDTRKCGKFLGKSHDFTRLPKKILGFSQLSAFVDHFLRVSRLGFCVSPGFHPGFTSLSPAFHPGFTRTCSAFRGMKPRDAWRTSMSRPAVPRRRARGPRPSCGARGRPCHPLWGTIYGDWAVKTYGWYWLVM